MIWVTIRSRSAVPKMGIHLKYIGIYVYMYNGVMVRGLTRGQYRELRDAVGVGSVQQNGKSWGRQLFIGIGHAQNAF